MSTEAILKIEVRNSAHKAFWVSGLSRYLSNSDWFSLSLQKLSSTQAGFFKSQKGEGEIIFLIYRDRYTVLCQRENSFTSLSSFSTENAVALLREGYTFVQRRRFFISIFQASFLFFKRSTTDEVIFRIYIIIKRKRIYPQIYPKITKKIYGVCGMSRIIFDCLKSERDIAKIQPSGVPPS